jgi:hypothetical protein
MAAAFDSLDRTPAGHFRLSLYGAVFRLVHRLHRLAQARGDEPDDLYRQFPFLRGYLDQLRPHLPGHLTWAESLRWWQTTTEAWEEECQAHLPLRAFPDLDDRARQALLTIGLVEEDSRFGTLFAWLQQPLGQRRPTLELVERLLGDEGETGGGAICRRLMAVGLVAVADRKAPRSEWELFIPEALWDVIRGETDLRAAPWCRHRPQETLPALGDLILPAETRRQLAALPALLGQGQVRTAVLRGPAGGDRLDVLGAVARGLGMGLIAVDGTLLRGGADDGTAATDSGSLVSQLGALCTMTRSLPVIGYDLAPGETATLPDLPAYAGPVGVLMGREGGLRGALAERSVTVTLPLPGKDLRRRHWAEALGEHAPADLEAISARFQLPGGYIRQAAGLAINAAALDGRSQVSPDDIREACGLLNRQMLDTLAVRLEPRGTWNDLVVSVGTRGKLRELELRCRHREALLEQVSPLISASGNRGVRALLAGPSGTGKTMAARTLAAVLGTALYRVDLAAVVNKYIGETEKNLHQVLTRAEELDVILLLDEGDALLAKRSEVKSANDRYANLETNYLLQRLEGYQGIALITTNAAELIDSAFQRRMDVVVQFLAPEADERAAIWQLHLPPGHAVDPGHLSEVAARCALTGGQIRNAAMLASLLALDAGGPVTRSHLDEAIESEYRKAGAISPLSDQPAAAGRRKGIEAFMEAMRDEP